VCALHCAQLLRTILHRTDLIIFPLTLQTITNNNNDNNNPYANVYGAVIIALRCHCDSSLGFCHLFLSPNAGTHFIVPQMVEGWVELGNVVRVCRPCPRLFIIYISVVINTNAHRAIWSWDLMHLIVTPLQPHNFYTTNFFTPQPQPFYGPFSGTNQVSRC